MTTTQSICNLLSISPLETNTCAGRRRDGGKCRNVVSIASRNNAYNIVGEVLDYRAESSKTQDRLEELAGLLLCKRWHQYQREELTDRWTDVLKRRERRPNTTTRTTTATPRTRAGNGEVLSTERIELAGSRPVLSSSASPSRSSSTSRSSASLLHGRQTTNTADQQLPLPRTSSADSRAQNIELDVLKYQITLLTAATMGANLLASSALDPVQKAAIQKAFETALATIHIPLQSADSSVDSASDPHDPPRQSHLECGICTEGYAYESDDEGDVDTDSDNGSTYSDSDDASNSSRDGSAERVAGIWECTSCLNRTHASCFKKWSEQAQGGSVRCVYCRAVV